MTEALQQDALAREIRVHGIVQGVGFRPTVWRLAREAELCGDVRNDAAGVRIRVCGPRARIEDFVARLRSEAPPLSRIDEIVVTPLDDAFSDDFRIIESAIGLTRTQVAPDAATCAACAEETLSPFKRRFLWEQPLWA